MKASDRNEEGQSVCEGLFGWVKVTGGYRREKIYIYNRIVDI